MNHLHPALSLCALALLTSCNSFRFPDPGPTPTLRRSKTTSTVVIESLTNKSLPKSNEWAPTVVDDADVAFVNDEMRNLDIRACSYQVGNQASVKELVATGSNEMSPCVRAGGTGEPGRCYFVTDSSGDCQVFSGTLPRVRSQTREVLVQRQVNWPHLSKDGTRMLYSALGPNRTYDVWMRDMRTGSESLIAAGQRARWNPGNPNEFVYMRRDRGVWTICKYDFKTAQPIEINPSGDDKFDPEYSPDGKWISFTSNELGSSDIWVMKADGAEARNLDPHGAIDCQAIWTPDGTSLLFVTDRFGSFDICRMQLPEFVLANEAGSGTPPTP